MGLIDSAPAVPAAQPAAAPQPAAGALPPALMPDAIMAKMHIPPNMAKPFQAVIVAGMKILFSDQTHAMVMKRMQAPGPVPAKLGGGIAAMMAMLFEQSGHSIPPQMIIPAGQVLLAHAADFLVRSGMPVSKQDYGAAVDVMTRAILKGFHLDPDKVLNQIATASRPRPGAKR